jgi:hypothetical protein
VDECDQRGRVGLEQSGQRVQLLVAADQPLSGAAAREVGDADGHSCHRDYADLTKFSSSFHGASLPRS